MNQTTLLSGKTILITRPLGRETHLRHLIETASGSVLHYPVFKIEPPSDLEIEQLSHLRDQLGNFTMAIFVSRTAVEQSQLYFPTLPKHLSVVSIGSKTTQALAQQNIAIDIEAPKHNTESLLQSLKLQTPDVQNQRILIFRGNGGRALLGDTLVSRGAEVRYVETYCRTIPPLASLTEQQINTLDAITISSNEGLNNLFNLTKNPKLLTKIPLFVPGRRAAALAKKQGFDTIITADNATDEAIISALNSYLSTIA